MQVSDLKRRLITSMVAMLLLIIALFGITYAYFTAKVKGNENDKSVEVSAGKLELTYANGNGNIMVENIEPGDDIKEKIFTVENTGDGDIEHYDVILENVVNNLYNFDDMTYTITCESNKGTCNSFEGVFPLYDNPIATNKISVGEVHTYTLKLNYNETNVDQSIDMNKNIEAKVNIRDSEKNYTKLNIYGKTILTDGKETKSLGTLVVDDESRFNGMYSVDLKLTLKNMFNVNDTESLNIAKANYSEYSFDNNVITVMGNEGMQAYAWSAGQIGIMINNKKLKAGNTYTFSFDTTLLEVGKYSKKIQIAVGYNSTETYFNYNKVIDTLELNKKVRSYITFTPKEDVDKITFRLNNNKIAIDLNSFQIEKGDKMTSYSPYIETTYRLYLREPLRCLDDKCDYIDYMNKKVVRCIKSEDGVLSLLDNEVYENIQVYDIDRLVDRNIFVDFNDTNISHIDYAYDR